MHLKVLPAVLFVAASVSVTVPAAAAEPGTPAATVITPPRDVPADGLFPRDPAGCCIYQHALPPPPNRTPVEQAMAAELAEYVNRERVARGRTRLPVSDRLNDLLFTHVNRLREQGGCPYNPQIRMPSCHSTGETRYEFLASTTAWFGEITASGPMGGPTASMVYQWMGSGLHRSAILETEFDFVGAAVACTASGAGYVVVAFGSRDVTSLDRPDLPAPPEPRVSPLGEGTSCPGPGVFPSRPVTTSQTTGSSGYRLVDTAGTVTGFGVPVAGPAEPGTTAIASAPGGGYWTVTGTGRVTGHLGARTFGNPPLLRDGERVVALTGTPTGNGYQLFTSLGRVFAYGDAARPGDLEGVRLNAPVIAAAVTSTGNGYWLVAADGGVFTFGDAWFHGSTGSMRLNEPVVGLVPTPGGRGYWLVASDGGVFAFGDAPFRGSIPGVLQPGQRLNAPIVGMVGYGNGYLMVAADGGVFTFSDLPFRGSLGGQRLPVPVISITAG